MLNSRTVHSILVLVFFMMVPIRGQDASRTSIGFGVSQSKYESNWFYLDPYSGSTTKYHYPWHVHTHTQIVAYVDRRLTGPSANWGIDLRLEAAVGINGSVNEDWLPSSEVVSNGATSIAVNPMVRLALPFSFMGGKMRPYLGAGIAVASLTADGEGALETVYASRSEYNYSDGWSEFLVTMFVPIGVSFKLGGGVANVEVRTAVAGSGETDWDPIGYDPSIQKGAYYTAIMMTYSFGRQTL